MEAAPLRPFVLWCRNTQEVYPTAGGDGWVLRSLRLGISVGSRNGRPRRDFLPPAPASVMTQMGASPEAPPEPLTSRASSKARPVACSLCPQTRDLKEIHVRADLEGAGLPLGMPHPCGAGPGWCLALVWLVAREVSQWPDLPAASCADGLETQRSLLNRAGTILQPGIPSAIPPHAPQPQPTDQPNPRKQDRKKQKQMLPNR